MNGHKYLSGLFIFRLSCQSLMNLPKHYQPLQLSLTRVLTHQASFFVSQLCGQLITYLLFCCFTNFVITSPAKSLRWFSCCRSPFKSGSALASRLCKAAMLHRFKLVAKEAQRQDLLATSSYREAKVIPTAPRYTYV